MMRIRCNNIEVANQVKVAKGSVERMIGLMFKKEMNGFDGLLIDPCNSIHTFFMKYHLDLIFIGKGNRIVKIIRNIAPWRMTWMYYKSHKVLELKGGTLPNGVNEGDILEVTNV